MTAVLAAITWLLLCRTSFGIQVRALMRNPAMAAACAIDTQRINVLTLCLRL